jgi:glycerate kinase
VGFAEALAGADLVVTGEGRLDDQTRTGKAPAAVARAAAEAGVRCVAAVGRDALGPQRWAEAGFDLVEAGPPDEAGARLAAAVVARA